MNKYLTVAKVNFKKTTWIAYLIAAICVAAMIADMIIDSIFPQAGETSVAAHCMLYIIPILAPIFNASVNYSKLMHIGVKKKSFFFGCMINYLVFAAVISLICVIEHYIIDPVFLGKTENSYDLFTAFNWDTSVVEAFFSQFAFLLLAEVAIHTLTFMQTKWYGWLADVLLVAIISVFTPIPVLRSAEEFFFRFTIFQTPAIIHIVISIVLAALIYSSNLVFLKNRNNA